MGHVLMENRHGLVVDARLTQADGYAERAAAVEMLEAIPEGLRITLGADRGYGTQDFVDDCRAMDVTPRHRGKLKVDWVFTFTAAAYNLVRMRNLAAVA